MEENETDSAISESNGECNGGIALDIFGIPLLGSSKKHNGIFCNGNISGITLAWKELSVYVPANNSGEQHRNLKRLLNNVTGIACPGSLTAIMGASGAGKTTLMNVLAHKSKGDVEIGGEILVNGRSIGPFIGNMSGYVYQEDIFVGTLTVAEHLHLMANIKLDRRLGRSERRRRVDELLTDLSLKKCENTRIGIPGQQTGISGGERKRLAFATEILRNPSLLFCDEPTTGLDSFSARKIVGMLKSMAAQGKTIVTTIHQPSSQVFAMFDQYCFLAEGRTAFIGSSEEATKFLNNMNFQCPPRYNLGDFYIRTLSVFPGKEFESRMSIKRICDNFAKSEQAEKIDEKVQTELKHFQSSYSQGNTKYHPSFNRRPNWFILTYWLLWRSMLNIQRNPKIQFTKFVQKIILAFIIGICYSGIQKDQDGIQNVQGVIFIIVTECTFPSLYGALYTFPSEFPLFLREQKAGSYRVSSYYVAKIISLGISLTVEGLIFSTITYWMVGLQANAEDFLLTSLVVILTTNIAGAFGCLFSAIFDKTATAIVVLIPLDYVLMVSGGQFMNLGTIPGYFSWVKYISWFMYSNEAISIVQWRNVANITCEATHAVPCVSTGEEVLELRSFDGDHLTFDFGGLTFLLILFHLAGYVSLALKSRKK